MAPDPGASDQGKRTVACNFESLVPDETHKAQIRELLGRKIGLSFKMASALRSARCSFPWE